MLQKQERGLAGFDIEVLLDFRPFLAAEGRVGKDDVETVLFLNIVDILAQRIGVQDIGCLDAVQDHVHDRDDISEALLLLAVKGAALECVIVAGRFGERLQIVIGFAQEPCRANRTVIYPVANLGLQHLDHRANEWAKLSEWMKLQLGFLIGFRLGGMAFTANVHVSLIEKWAFEGMSVSQLIQKRLKKEIDKAGLGSLPYCYVIETRTKSGKSRTKPHLHGFLLVDDRRDYTKFKLAVERALLSGDLRGNSNKVTMKFDNFYDHKGSDRYVSYITKNVHRWDQRIRGRNVYMSRPFTQTVREFWALIREEPVA